MREAHGDARWNPSRPLLRRLLHYRTWLRAGRAFTASQAADELEVSERTVRRDLDGAREDLRWDVQYSRERNGYVLASGDVSLPVVSLRQGELVALLVGEQALRQYAGTPYAEALRGALATIVSALDAPVTLDLRDAGLPRFTGPPARPVALAQFEQLTLACQRRRRLEMTYHSLGRDEITTRQIDPYHLFAHAGDWYVVAFDHLRREIREFALGDRMKSIRETGETFALDPQFDLDRYLAEGFALFRGGEAEEVVLRFDRSVARYMREKVWAEGEVKEDLPEGGLLLRMRVPVNVGLLRFVLQYGGAVEVLAPPSFRCQVADEGARLSALYERDSG